MALNIETFSNTAGGHSFFKAVGHPLAAELGRDLVASLIAAGSVAIYDPHGLADAFAELIDLSDLTVAGSYVQQLPAVGTRVLGKAAEPITELRAADCATVLVVAFDADRLIDHIRHLLPDGADVVSLDAMRLPDEMLTNHARYLDKHNFANNFALFRDAAGHHTRVVTANYWSGYGASGVRLWCRLFGDDGAVLAQWEEAVADAVSGIVIDSKDVRARFGLGDFTGQLFIHVIGAKGHDVVKYALDTYGDDDSVLSCTHDANAWPADRFAGLPAPKDGEKVVLWIQNSHPRPIPAKGVGLNFMGAEEVVWLDRSIPAFGSYPLDVTELLPEAAHPRQIEVQAGKYFVRPRYEISAADGRTRIAHANVERTDLAPDPKIPELANLMGKGFVLPAPILPQDRFSSALLPTPMSTGQINLPVAVTLHSASGDELHRHRFGTLARQDSVWSEIDDLIGRDGALGAEAGHMEVVYDFADGGEADGWLHAIFRYQDRATGHIAETSFGAHIFNTVLVYKGEPQSYAGPAPGLSTRLFLRLGEAPLDTMCHLIYTAAGAWHKTSETRLTLTDAAGRLIEERTVNIPLNGSLHWRASEMFGPEALRAAAGGGYVLIRDTTCRLFGYHGLIRDGHAFSFDHMFGF